MRKGIIAIAMLAIFVSCKQKDTSTTITSSEVPNEVAFDTVDIITNQQKPSSDENLSSEGSSLTGDVSNLNIDIKLKADQLFDFDKATLKPEAEPQLQKVFDDINGKTESVIEIIGHTDAKGSPQYNKNLSIKRAEAVKKWLEDKGLKNPISTTGKGANVPIAPNKHPDGSDNPEGRAENRRVEIKSAGKQSL